MRFKPVLMRGETRHQVTAVGVGVRPPAVRPALVLPAEEEGSSAAIVPAKKRPFFRRPAEARAALYAAMASEQKAMKAVTER